jgi:lipoprotein NlpI
MKPFRVAAFIAAIFTCAIACAQIPTAPEAVAATSAPQVDREVQIAADAFVKDPKVPAWVQPHPIPESKAAGPAVIQLSDNQFWIGDEKTIYVRNAIRINNAVALTPLGRVPLQFIPEYQHVVLHTLQVIRDGVVLDRLPGAQVRFLQREAALENYIYSGIVTASILIDDLRVNDTIEIAYSVTGTNPVFGSKYSNLENWDQALPVDFRRVIVNTPVARPLHWKFHGDLSKNFPEPTESIANGVRTLTFEERDVPRVAAELLTPAGYSTYRWLQLSEYDDWQGVGSWAASLFDVSEAPSAERSKLVASLMTKPTTEERVVGALEFVQSQVRYFSVSLGTSSHRPTAPNTVIQRRYGDCKDKSLLLITLLKDMGIPSIPVLARLGNRTGFDDWLPTPLAFDHVIVAVDIDGSRYWLDSTRQGQHGKLVAMGQAHDGAQVLPASSVEGRLERIEVANRDALNLNEITESLTVEKLDGDGKLTVVQTLHGVIAESARAGVGVLPKERVDESLTNDMQKRYPEARLVDGLQVDDDRENNRLTLTTQFTLKKPLEHAQGQYRFNFRAANFARVFTLPSESIRRTPIVVRYPVNVVYHFDAKLPDEVAVVENHRTVPVDGRFFVATSTRTFTGNHSEVSMQLRTLVDRVPANEVPTIREDIRKLDRFPGAVVIADADIKKSGLFGIGAKDFAATLKTRQEDLVAKTTATIKAGRLGGADLARTYCARAYANASLGHRAEAVEDSGRAVELDPNSVSTLECRAGLRVQFGEFAAAIDDASQAIVLGADTGVAWQSRGEARFYLGRYAEAAEDFAKAATVDRDERTNANHDLWRAMAFRRMNKPIPDDLQKQAADASQRTWPRPALALFADRMKPDELTALAASRPGDEATMNATEADFYLGEFYLANGDPVKARESFVAARARGVIVYAEYAAAALELDKLDRAGR